MYCRTGSRCAQRNPAVGLRHFRYIPSTRRTAVCTKQMSRQPHNWRLIQVRGRRGRSVLRWCLSEGSVWVPTFETSSERLYWRNRAISIFRACNRGKSARPFSPQKMVLRWGGTEGKNVDGKMLQHDSVASGAFGRRLV